MSSSERLRLLGPGDGLSLVGGGCSVPVRACAWLEGMRLLGPGEGLRLVGGGEGSALLRRRES